MIHTKVGTGKFGHVRFQLFLDHVLFFASNNLDNFADRRFVYYYQSDDFDIFFQRKKGLNFKRLRFNFEFFSC